MKNDYYEIAAAALGITSDQVRECSKELPKEDALYAWNPARGGLAVFVASDGSKLVAGSAVRFDDHLEAFKSGRRN